MRTILQTRRLAACRALFLAGAGLCSAGWLNAGIVQVASSAALGANDSVLWGQFGPVNMTLLNTNNFTSTKGLAGSIVDGPSNSPQLRDKAIENLTTNPVYDNQYGPPVTINFNSAVSGVGVLMMNEFGSLQPFSYHMQVFNSGGSLGTWNVASPQQNNTPSYIGVLDSLSEITKVIFTVDATSSNSGNYMALDTLNLVDNAGQPTSGVPEPSSIVLAGIGGLILIGSRIVRRRVD
jgi:hypothetical protein